MNDNPLPTQPPGAPGTPGTTQIPGTPRVAWWALACAIVALLVGLVALLVAVGADDSPADSGDTAVTGSAPSTVATAPPETDASTLPSTLPVPAPSTTTAADDPTVLPPTTVVGEVSPAIWPRYGSTTRYDDPVVAAQAFAVEFVGFDPVIVGEFQAGDSRSGDVEVRSRPNGSPTVVHVRQVDGEDWAVIGASNANITITQPAALAEIESPMTLTGSATAFEGTVQVRLYSDGSDEPIVEAFVTGNGGPEPGPFADVLEWNAVTAEGATLLLFSTSPEDDSVVDAAAVRLRFHSVAV